MCGERLRRTAGWIAGAFVTPILFFMLAGWIGSSIPRNAGWEEPDTGITILVGTNGVHTEIVMPLVTAAQDWRTTFPASNVTSSMRPYTHVAVSWGERTFFLETPTWADTNPITAAQALIGGEGVLHVAHYVRPATSLDYRALRLRKGEYRRLAQAISSQLDQTRTRQTLPGYGKNDVFYSARGSYHLGNTCNQWTSDQLAHAGVRIGAWSPFPGGVMKWLPHSE